MFSTAEKAEETPPTPFVLSDIHPTIFLAQLEFIYTNCCSLSTDMVKHNYYTFTCIILKCCKMLNIFSDFLQVIDVLAASIEYGLDGLTKVIASEASLLVV